MLNRIGRGSQTVSGTLRAGIRLDAYQLLPLAEALALPRVNLQIADDLGLGKTVEAGLIVREMLLRRRVEVVVATPASMVLQWQDELAQKFGLEFISLQTAAKILPPAIYTPIRPIYTITCPLNYLNLPHTSVFRPYPALAFSPAQRRPAKPNLANWRVVETSARAYQPIVS